MRPLERLNAMVPELRVDDGLKLAEQFRRAYEAAASVALWASGIVKLAELQQQPISNGEHLAKVIDDDGNSLRAMIPLASEAINAVVAELLLVRNGEAKHGALTAATSHQVSLLLADEVLEALELAKSLNRPLVAFLKPNLPQGDEIVAGSQIEAAKANDRLQIADERKPEQQGDLEVGPGLICWRDGIQVDITGQPLAVLRLLLANQAQSLSVGVISASLYPNDEIAYPEQAVKDAVCDLRKALRRAISSVQTGYDGNPIVSAGRGAQLTYSLRLPEKSVR